VPYFYRLPSPDTAKTVLLHLSGARLRLFGACLLSAVLLASCSNRTELPQSVNNLIFKTLTGKEIALRDLNVPVLVNFWSTSCVICVHEMPDMAEMYAQYAPGGFELIAVAMPYDAPNEVVELAEAQALPFPVALDLQGTAVDAFDSVKGTPTSFLIDSEGKLVKRYVGAIDLLELRSQLNTLLTTN